MTETRAPRLLLAAALVAAPLLFAGCVSSQIPSEGSQGTTQTQSSSDPDDDATTGPDDDGTDDADTDDADTDDTDDNTSSGSRPSVEEIADGFEAIMDDVDAGDLYTREEAICIAEILRASEISDQDLANIADGRDIQTSIEARNLVSEVTGQAAATCLAQ